MKKFIKHEYDDIGRQYLFDDNTKYYSVTTVLGATKDKRFLIEWRKKVGLRTAEAITRAASVTGTHVHEALEYYLKNVPYTYPNAVIKNLVHQITPYIDKRVKHVYATEKFLYSDKLKLAGTVDAIVDYSINDKVYYSILDFKTAGNVPKAQWIQDYLLQLAIYSMMVAEMTGKKEADIGVLLFAYKKVRSRNNQVVVNLSKYKKLALKRIELFHKHFK